MIVSFFKIAFRHLSRNRVFTFINLTGLTLGMTCALLAILFIKDERGYDRWHRNADRLYRLHTITTDVGGGAERVLATTGQVQGPAFKAAIPEIEDYVRVLGNDGMNLTGNGKSLAVKNIFADSGWFNVLSFPLMYGHPGSVLSGSHSIVLSESTALKFFGTADVVGRTLKVEEGRGREDMVVTGVAKDAPSNSSLQFDVVLPFSYLQLMFKDDNWQSQYLTTFVLLRPGADLGLVEKKMTAVYLGRVQGRAGVGPKVRYGLSPFTAMHLHTTGSTGYGTADVERGLSSTSNTLYSYILLGIVGFILLMACVNFINLSVADSLRRTKEVWIRRVIGSGRRHIMLQFLTEAGIVCFASYSLAVMLCRLLLPHFNQLAGKSISLSIVEDWSFFFDGFMLMVLCVLVAGGAVAGRQKTGGGRYWGKGLVVLQFTLAIILVISSFVYYYQMKFISSRELGYSPRGVVKVHVPPQRADARTLDIFRNELKADPSVREVAGTTGIGIGTVRVNGGDLAVKMGGIDGNYISALGIQLKEGRHFYIGSDSGGAVIVNEAFEKAAGWKNAVGRQVTIAGDSLPGTIVGVVKDFHYTSLRENIDPLVLRPGNTDNLLVKVQDGKTAQALSAIDGAFRRVFPDHYYAYQFLDDANAAVYATDEKWERIIFYSAAIAMVICCIGAFGLSIFAAQQRVKEIGIRKVLGASVLSITSLLTRDLIKLVVLSIVIASPIAWLVMRAWLDGFAYRVRVEWWIFVLAGLLCMLIAFFTISIQSIRSALANPVESLKA